MKKWLLIVFLTGLLWVLPGCTADTPRQVYDALAEPGTEFPLPLGQTAYLDGSNLYITFAEVLNDNRCPRGAQCIVAGHVTVRLEFTDETGSGETTVDNDGLTDQLRAGVWNGHRFEFRVGPYPMVDEEIDPASYYLLLKFTG